MDEKLEKYRTKVQRKAFFDKVKQRLLNMIPFSPENRNEKKNEETILISDVRMTYYRFLMHLESINLFVC